MQTEIRQEALKATPPVAVTGWSFLTDLTLNDWVAISTIAYIVLQAFFLIRDRVKKAKKK